MIDKDPERGIRYLDSAFEKSGTPSVYDKFKILSYHFVIAGKVRRNFPNALVYADSMLTYINENGGQTKYPSSFAEANFAKGDAYFDLHDYNNAYKYYFNGYRAGKNYLDNFVISSYSYRMGMITYQQSHYNLAIKYFKDSFEQGLPYDNNFLAFYRNQEVLDNIALAYRHLDSMDSAMLYFNKNISYINKKAPAFPNKSNMATVAVAVVNGNKADIYIKRKQYQQAIDLLNNSIAVNLKAEGDKPDALQSEIKLAKIYASQNKDEQLQGLLNDIHTQFKTIQNKNAEADWYMLSSDLYLHKNQPALALNYNRRYNVLKDSLNESTYLLKETNISEQINNYENENKITNLTSYNKLQGIYLVVLVIAAMLALLLILLIYRNWRRSKREVFTISMLNNEVNNQKASLETTLAQLNKSSQEKDRILHTVAHDLRNPLGGIASLTNAMVADEGLTLEHKEYINIIKDTADNSLELINEIFEATDSSTTETELQLVDINLLLNNSVELLRFKAAEKKQHIIYNPLKTPAPLMISREKMWRVISNLIVNAIKFSPAGSTIIVSAEHQNDEVCISVKDEGIGIPEEMSSKVFNMFTEAKRPGTMGEKSFGLGLSICFQIIEKHKGRIWFANNPDKGTTFFISLKKTPVAA